MRGRASWALFPATGGSVVYVGGRYRGVPTRLAGGEGRRGRVRIGGAWNPGGESVSAHHRCVAGAWVTHGMRTGCAWRVRWRCMGGAWEARERCMGRVYERCVGGAWEVRVRCVRGAWGECMRGAWEVRGRCV